MAKKMLIAGASGVVGSAAMEHFSRDGAWDVVGVSRRPPLVPLGRAIHIPADLTDQQACARIFGAMPDVTHLVYTALTERDDDIVAGWSDPAQIAKNAAMLSNLFDPLIAVAKGFRHVSLVHGGKAYGVHLPGVRLPLPVREDLPRHAGDNFYHRQEDYIASKQAGSDWSWTIFRPYMVVGSAVGANMSTFLVLAVFAALRRDAGLDLPMPSGRSQVAEMTDADLIADALGWAAEAPGARDQIFNITNGDVLSLHDAFPIIADAMGMPLGSPRSFDINAEIEALADTWPAIVAKYDLHVPADLSALLGNSQQVAGGWSADVAPGGELRWGLTSTIKLRHAGFPGCVDTHAMLARYVGRFRDLRIIP
jgi:nucleoside-diphosphate-sugar epimerase